MYETNVLVCVSRCQIWSQNKSSHCRCWGHINASEVMPAAALVQYWPLQAKIACVGALFCTAVSVAIA